MCKSNTSENNDELFVVEEMNEDKQGRNICAELS